MDITLQIAGKSSKGAHGVTMLLDGRNVARGTFRRPFEPDAAKGWTSEERGRKLYEALLGKGNLHRAWRQAQIFPSDGLRLLLQLPADGSLDGLPWEEVYDGDTWYASAPGHSLVRWLPAGDGASPSPTPGDALRVLAVIASPVLTHVKGDRYAPVPTLDWQVEVRTLSDALSSTRGPVHARRLMPPTFPALSDALARETFAVVHFSGHGTAQDGAVWLGFDKGDGLSQQVNATDVAQALAGRGVRLLVLSACLSAAAPEARELVSAGVPFVVAMRRIVPDAAATAFAGSLYTFLAAGHPVDRAVTEARIALRLQFGVDVAAIPVLMAGRPPEPLLAPGAAGAPDVALHAPLPATMRRVTDHFVGRRAEIVQLSRLLGASEPSVVTIRGPGGMGKTALALEVVQRNLWRFPDGLAHASAERRPGFGVADVLRAVHEAMPYRGLGLLAPEKQEAAALEALRQSHCLLFLDNLEESAHLEEIRDFLSRVGGSTKVLVTSREPVLDREGGLSLTRLEAPDGVDLLRYLGRAKTIPTLALGSDEALGQIVEKVGGNHEPGHRGGGAGAPGGGHPEDLRPLL